MATFIDGVAASENIDSSGERISIAGLDISSLEKDGVFNYEHKNDHPNQVVGKILKARKIMDEKDCEDDRQSYFWKKVLCPFLYVMGELFDDYTESAKDLAGKFRYDADKKGTNENGVMNFSIEGAKMDKQGMDITRSIARKVTITVLPCNKAAVAEIVPAKKDKKDDLSSIFKTEPAYEVELFKFEGGIPMMKDEKPTQGAQGSQPQKPTAPAQAAPSGTAMALKPPSMPGPEGHLAPKLSGNAALGAGAHLGTTTSGKNVFTHQKIHQYNGFTSKDHHEAATMHHEAAGQAKTAASASHHVDKAKLHTQAAGTKEKHETRFGKELATAKTKAIEHAKLGKAMDAGSGMAAPSQLTGGAALASESLEGKKKSKKSKGWLERAEKEFDSWGKKEEFRTFMKSKMPLLAMGEIDAIGKTLALKKSLEAEKSLSKMVGLEKGEYKKKPRVTKPFDSKVSRIEPYGDKHETIHLESGHELDGHPKGKYKVGDEVSVKPHIMGTHLMDHKKG